MKILVANEDIALAMGLKRVAITQKEMRAEYPVVGNVLALAKKTGTKGQGQQRVPVHNRTWRKLHPLIAFVGPKPGGKPARDKIYPMRHKLYAEVTA